MTLLQLATTNDVSLYHEQFQGIASDIIDCKTSLCLALMLHHLNMILTMTLCLDRHGGSNLLGFNCLERLVTDRYNFKLHCHGSALCRVQKC